MQITDLREKTVKLDCSLPSSPKAYFKNSMFRSPKAITSQTSLKPTIDNSDSDSMDDDLDNDSPLQQFLQAEAPNGTNSKAGQSSMPPANPIEKQKYSMEPDMLFGWKPKYVPQAPVPLRFFSPMLEDIVSTLYRPGENQFPDIVYQGFRPENTLFMHEQFSSMETYSIKFSPFLAAKHAIFCKYAEKNMINPKRPFLGMKAGVQEDCLVFDSIFEHGNLDTVVRKSSNEYDLFLRVDSNTRGHTNWYYFTVKNMKKGQRVKFNVMNFSKNKSLYQRGMKPYVRSEKLFEEKKIDWYQNGQNVSYILSNISYKGQNFEESNHKKYYKLSFEYVFDYEDDMVSFALCIPYTYTRLFQFVQGLVEEQKAIKSGSFLTTSKLCYSLGGVGVPVITITDPDLSEIPLEKRQYVICTGRVHPGESNSSWMIQGFISELCKDTSEVQYLRKRFIFKIIPMLNPDGVILGNHRTGMCGNDLNRQFVSPKQVLHPSVIALKELVKEIVWNDKEIFAYVDFHGHSLKKNVFMYGAEFPVYDLNYYRVKALPKLLSKRNPMFRFRSCTFTISKPKMTTARAVFSMQFGVTHFYTLEASYANYIDDKRETIEFDAKGFMVMGASVSGAFHDYRKLLDEEEAIAASLKMKKEDLLRMNMMKESEYLNFERNKFKPGQPRLDEKPTYRASSENPANKDVPEGEKRKNKKFIIRKGKALEIEGGPNNGDLSLDSIAKNKTDGNITKELELNLIELLLQYKQKFGIFRLMEQKEINQDLAAKKEDRDESDSFSEGGSDSEDSEDDFQGEDMKKLQKNILKRVEKFHDICKNEHKYEARRSTKIKKIKKGNGDDSKLSAKEKPKTPRTLIKKAVTTVIPPINDQSPKEKKIQEASKSSRQSVIQMQSLSEKNTSRLVITQRGGGDQSSRLIVAKPKSNLLAKEVQIDNQVPSAITQIKNQLSAFYLSSLNGKKDSLRSSLTAQSSRKQLETMQQMQKGNDEITPRQEMSLDQKKVGNYEAAKLIHMNSQMDKNYPGPKQAKSPFDFLFASKGIPSFSQIPKENENSNTEGEPFVNIHIDKIFKTSMGFSKFRTPKDTISVDYDRNRELTPNPYLLKQPGPQSNIHAQATEDQDFSGAVARCSSRGRPGFRGPYMMTVATAQIYTTIKEDFATPGVTPLKKDSKLPISFEAYKKMLHSRRKVNPELIQ